MFTFADIGLYSLVLDNTIQYNTIQYNTIQYNTIQYNTIQYNTILKSYKQDVQSIATFTKKDKSNVCFKNITYV
jgi:hypothetical protein